MPLRESQLDFKNFFLINIKLKIVVKLKVTQSVSGLFCILPSFYREPEGRHKDFFPRTAFQIILSYMFQSFDPYELYTFNRWSCACIRLSFWLGLCGVLSEALVILWQMDWEHSKSHKNKKINKQTSLCHFCSHYCKTSMSQTKHQAPGPGCSFSHVDIDIIAKLCPQSPSVLTLVSESRRTCSSSFLFFVLNTMERICAGGATALSTLIPIVFTTGAIKVSVTIQLHCFSTRETILPKVLAHLPSHPIWIRVTSRS